MVEQKNRLWFEADSESRGGATFEQSPLRHDNKETFVPTISVSLSVEPSNITPQTRE